MSIDIQSLEEFGPALAAYKVARGNAQQQGDDLALSQAELGWERKQRELEGIARQRSDATTAREVALAKAKAEFPHAPEAAYAGLTDPTAILETAKHVHDTVATELGKNTPPPSWGAPGAAGGATPPPQDIHARKVELVPSVLRGKAGERDNEEFRRLIFRDQIGSRFDFNLPPAGVK